MRIREKWCLCLLSKPYVEDPLLYWKEVRLSLSPLKRIVSEGTECTATSAPPERVSGLVGNCFAANRAQLGVTSLSDND